MASSRQTFTHTSIPIHPSTLLKQTRSKTRNSPNMTPSLSCPLHAQCACGRRPGSLADAPQDSSTSEAFSPTTVLTENICRCVQHLLQHFQTMPFLTTSKIALSWLASAVPQADSWWLGHVEPDDVVIADIAGQALDIFLHGPESAHKNGILKTFTNTSITMHTSQKQTQRVNIFSSPNMMPSFSCPLPVQRGAAWRPGSSTDSPQDCSTSEAFSPTTVLTENICRCVQQIYSKTDRQQCPF